MQEYDTYRGVWEIGNDVGCQPHWGKLYDKVGISPPRAYSPYSLTLRREVSAGAQANMRVGIDTAIDCSPQIIIDYAQRYEARLWDIHGDWMTLCVSTPHDINGHHFDRPTHCQNRVCSLVDSG